MIRRLFTSLSKLPSNGSAKHLVAKMPNYSQCFVYRPISLFSDSQKGSADTDSKGFKIDLNEKLAGGIEINLEDRTIKTSNGENSVSYQLTDEVKGATLGDNERYVIMMTCEVCNHKMTKTFTKKAYHTGVVLIVCDNCENIHLIADNLGWFRDKSVNIEDLAKEKGKQAVKVNNHPKLQQLLNNLKFVGYKETIHPGDNKQTESEEGSAQLDSAKVEQIENSNESDKNSK